MLENEAQANPPRRFALLLEYDGKRFAGSQMQPEAPTVQSELETAIGLATSEPSRASFAGRTDAGVHAIGQVASFVSSTRLAADVLRRALNAHLPPDVAVLAVSTLPDDFDPRRQAVRRFYRYTIENRPSRPVLSRETAWHVPLPLDVESMQRAAQGILGHRDFAAFASKLPTAEASTWRELMSFDVVRDGTRVLLDVTGNAFLPHQVRRMTGALVEVGKGKCSVAEYVALLECAPATVGPAAPAHGLCLMRVDYERDIF